MNKKVDYIAYIGNTYDENYEVALLETDNRLAAQRKAIDNSFVSALKEFYPNATEEEIWAGIAEKHKLKIANLGEFGLSESQQREVLHRCLSAHQSWIKTSGHSFERFVSSISNDELAQNEIRFILQKELTELIKNKQLSNTEDDIVGLQNWGKDFDLYALQSVHGEQHIFGCIQVKTSIRDRVGRDVGFSRNAMEGLFWSVAVTLDGAFLNMNEFKQMVNGGGSYPTNGWHGMYALSGIDKDFDRIYKVDENLEKFAKHAVIAAKQFIRDRRELKNTWKAE